MLSVKSVLLTSLHVDARVVQSRVLIRPDLLASCVKVDYINCVFISRFSLDLSILSKQ